jgi:hypothetical protein
MQERDGYEGPATLVAGNWQFTLMVRLGGHFDPLAGRYRWYGRLEASEELTRELGDRPRWVRLHTDEGEAEGEVADPDVWHRYRIEGTSMPPFWIPLALEDVETG